MMESGSLLGKPGLTRLDMQQVVIQTTEPDPTRESNEKVVNILDSTYTKSDLDKASKYAVQLYKN